MTAVMTSASILKAQFGNFLTTYGIGFEPVAVMRGGGLSFATKGGAFERPVPLIDESRGEVISLACSDRLPLDEADRRSVDEIVAQGPEDRFIAAWEDIRGSLDQLDRLYSVGNSNRMEKLDSVIRLLDGEDLRYASRAMVGEHDAARVSRENEDGSQRAARLIERKLCMAATSWLNFARLGRFTGAFKRNAISRSILYSWHLEKWHVAELGLLTSASFYVQAGRFETAAQDRLRAAMAHLSRERHSMPIVARHVEEALKCFGWMKPPPSYALMTEAEQFKDAAESGEL